jgi:hypothetical protein
MKVWSRKRKRLAIAQFRDFRRRIWRVSILITGLQRSYSIFPAIFTSSLAKTVGARAVGFFPAEFIACRLVAGSSRASLKSSHKVSISLQYQVRLEGRSFLLYFMV